MNEDFSISQYIYNILHSDKFREGFVRVLSGVRNTMIDRIRKQGIGGDGKKLKTPYSKRHERKRLAKSFPVNIRNLDFSGQDGMLADFSKKDFELSGFDAFKSVSFNSEDKLEIAQFNDKYLKKFNQEWFGITVSETNEVFNDLEKLLMELL